MNYKKMKEKIIAGYNVSCVGDNRQYSFLPSRNGDTYSDIVAKHVIKWIDKNYKEYSWSDRGSDERQYCSPGIDLPVASIMRSKYGEYPEYHTSLDNLDLVVNVDGFQGSYELLEKIIDTLEKNNVYKITTLCEPNMGRRGLYPTLSKKEKSNDVKLMMNFITWCDGSNSILDIAKKLDIPIWNLYKTVDILKEEKLIK